MINSHHFNIFASWNDSLQDVYEPFEKNVFNEQLVIIRGKCVFVNTFPLNLENIVLKFGLFVTANVFIILIYR